MEGGDRMSRFREARHGRGAGDFPIRSRSSGGSASNDPLALMGGAVADRAEAMPTLVAGDQVSIVRIEGDFPSRG